MQQEGTMDKSQLSMEGEMEFEGVGRKIKETASEVKSKVNVGTTERFASAAAGGALLFYGIKRKSWIGTLIALGGGNLLLRGALGRSLIYSAFGINTARKS